MLSTIGVMVPVDFPRSLYELVASKAELTGPGFNEERALFRAAWNGVAYRFLEVAKRDADWSASLAAAGTNAQPVDRAIQQSILFDFHAAAVSVVECFAFGSYVVGSIASPADFPNTAPADQRKINIGSTIAAYRRIDGQHPLAVGLAAATGAPEFATLDRRRNYLIHRSAPGRQMYRVAGEAPVSPDEWALGIHGETATILDDALTAVPRRWLATLLTPLFEEIHAVLERLAH